ncbi:MAG: NAD(P)-dependent oxidoreductase, partial [Verrucomicrobiota bacterium]
MSVESPPAGDPVGVIGLGLMGTAITERLLERGAAVWVWNRTPDKAGPLLARGAGWSDNPLAQCRRVILSLYDSQAVAETLERLASGLAPGRLVVDTTTGDPLRSEAMARALAERGVIYLEAPISGSSEQTRRGEATVLVGGATEGFEACSDLWPALGRQVFHVGPSGSAARMKLVTNLVLGLNRAALAEGLALAEHLGLDAAGTLRVLAGTVAYSRTMDTKGRKMVDRDYSVQARLSQHLKDVRLILEQATQSACQLPFSELHRVVLEQLEDAGHGDLDNSAIIKAYD